MWDTYNIDALFVFLVILTSIRCCSRWWIELIIQRSAKEKNRFLSKKKKNRGTLQGFFSIQIFVKFIHYSWGLALILDLAICDVWYRNLLWPPFFSYDKVAKFCKWWSEIRQKKAMHPPQIYKFPLHHRSTSNKLNEKTGSFWSKSPENWHRDVSL